MANFEKTKSELLKRMNSSHGMVTLTMNCDHNNVMIDKWLNNTYNVYFARVDMCATAKDIDEVVTWLVEYPKKAKELAYNEDVWVEENKPKLKEFFDKYIDGKTFEEIDAEDWDWYSDYHKDVFGYRPHGLVFGERI